MPRGKRKASSQSTSQPNRAENWTTEEKELLCSLVADKISVVECKKIDVNSVKKKNQAWLEIHQMFSSSTTGSVRHVKELKEQWKRMKTSAKTEVSNSLKEIRQTGGGPPAAPVSDLTLKIKELIPREFSQLSNPFDDDMELNRPIDPDDSQSQSVISESQSSVRSQMQSPTPSYNDVEAAAGEEQFSVQYSSATQSSSGVKSVVVTAQIHPSCDEVESGVGHLPVIFSSGIQPPNVERSTSTVSAPSTVSHSSLLSPSRPNAACNPIVVVPDHDETNAKVTVPKRLILYFFVHWNEDFDLIKYILCIINLINNQSF
jgi:hypothetical protein